MILVIDLEATCWDTEKYPECKIKQKDEMEIIEIGAALMFPLDMSNGYSFETISFSQFIKPVRNPILTDYCKDLTSISQKDVDNAPVFTQALSAFVCAVEKHLGGGSIDRILWASWGGYDRKQLIKDCLYNNIKYPFGTHWNVKVAYSINRGVKKGFGLKKAIQQCDLEFVGTAHRGVDDAINIAAVIKEKLTDDYFNYIKKTIFYK